jgi:hypothetical protein
MNRVYVFVDFAYGNLKPSVCRIHKATPYLDSMYNNLGCDIIGSRRDMERLDIFPLHPPLGARVRMLPFNLPRDFFERKTEPDGPDLVDLMTERCINEYRQKNSLPKKD